MKKSIVLILVALICVSAVFAADNSVKVSAVPITPVTADEEIAIGKNLYI